MELFLRRVIFCVLIALDIIAFLMIASYIISFFKLDIFSVEVASTKIPNAFNGFKILQLSDLHNRECGKDNKKLIKLIEKQNPDIIVMTGDMVSSNSKNFEPFFELVSGLNNKYPVYYILGNHEQRLPIEKQAKIVGKLTELGVNVLRNDGERIIRENESISIYGLEQSIIYYNNYIKSKKAFEYSIKDMENNINKPNSNEYNIVLAHNPLHFEIYEKWGADLVFSGHVHGGLVRLPFIGGILSPERKLFPKYSGGEYEINDSKMIVSRGIGYSTINLRIFNNPQICVVNLKSTK